MVRRMLSLLIAVALLAMSPVAQGVMVEHPRTPREYWGLAHAGSSDDSSQTGLGWVCAAVNWEGRYTLSLEEGSPGDELLLRIPLVYSNGQVRYASATASLGKPAVLELETNGCGHDFLVDAIRVETVATYHVTIEDLERAQR